MEREEKMKSIFGGWLNIQIKRFFRADAHQNDKSLVCVRPVEAGVCSLFRLGLSILLLVSSFGARAAEDPVSVTGLTLDGEIEGENIVFTLVFDADVRGNGVAVPVVVGDVAYLDGKLPRGSELVRESENLVDIF